MSIMEPVKIYPSTNIHKELPAEQAEAVMKWFRSNGVNPIGVPMDQLVVIDDVIDFWWWTKPSTPEPEESHVLERSFEADAYPLSHHQIRVTVPLPSELEAALRGLQAKWDDLESEVRAKLRDIDVARG